MKKLSVAVLFGGCSAEYEVSLQSAYGVITHLDETLYEPVLIGITKEGKWYLYEGSREAILKDQWFSGGDCIPAAVSPDRELHGILLFEGEKITSRHIDVAFPVLHGKNGEEGTVQGVFELAGIPVVGCGVLSSALCMDKEMAHRVAAIEGISIPKGVVVSSPAEVQKQVAKLSYPLYIKPVQGGSSLGISKIEKADELEDAVNRALEYDQRVIIEENIPGYEVGCAVLGNEELTMGAIDEIQLSSQFFDYHKKYESDESGIRVPAELSKSTESKIRSTAEKIYRAMGCRGYSRVDLFLTPEGEIVFNEVNTIPGLTTHSRYPNMLKEAGISFSQMVNQLIELAVAG